MEASAQWLGAHAVEAFLAVLAALFALWFALWRLFERYEGTLWRAAGFAGRHVPALRYLGVHLLAGLAVCFAALAGFAGVAEEIVEVEEWDAFDRALASAVGRSVTPAGVAALSAVTYLGDTWLISGVCLVGAAGLWLRGQRILLAGWLSAFAGGALLNLALKAVFRRERPELGEPLIEALGWSFPSGHAMGATVAYGMIAYLLVLRFGRAPAPAIVAAATALVLSVGFSRVYLGVHYLSDVLGGFLAGIAWVAVCASAMEMARRHARKRAGDF